LHIKLFFLIFCTVFVAGATSAQLTTPPVWQSLAGTNGKKKPINHFSLNHSPDNTVQLQSPKPAISVITPNYYASGLSFFCRQELKLEKITRIPFRFRLGSVVTCDRLEGKRVSITQ
jgi:hypothetical protein